MNNFYIIIEYNYIKNKRSWHPRISGPCKKDTGSRRFPESSCTAVPSGAAKPFPAIQEPDSGYDQGGRQADIENRNERIGKQSEGAGCRSERNHRSHHDPSFDIEKGERTTPSFLALDPVRVSEIKPFKNKQVE